MIISKYIITKAYLLIYQQKKEQNEQISIDKLSFKEVTKDAMNNKEQYIDSLFHSTFKNSQLLKYAEQVKNKANTQQPSYNQILLK